VYLAAMKVNVPSAERRTTYVYDDKGQVVTVIYPKPEAVLLLTKPLAYFSRSLSRTKDDVATSPGMRHQRRSRFPADMITPTLIAKAAPTAAHSRTPTIGA